MLLFHLSAAQQQISILLQQQTVMQERINDITAKRGVVSPEVSHPAGPPNPSSKALAAPPGFSSPGQPLENFVS